MLTQRFGDKLAGKAVSLQAFTIHLNNSAALRRQVGAMYTGLIPSLMNKKEKVGCAPDDLRGGYVLGEVSADKSPLIAVIDLRIDDRPFHARAIGPAEVPPARKKTDQALKDQWNSRVGSVVQMALDRLGDQIGQQLFGEAVPAAPAEPVAEAGPAATPQPPVADGSK